MGVGTGDTGDGIALIGYGAIAEMHADALAALGHTPVTVAGPKATEAEAFAARRGIPSWGTDVAAAIEDPRVGAVILATPSPVHADQAALALRSGRHVLVEIPLALSSAEGQSLVDQAHDAGLVLSVCHTLRYWEPFDRLHAWLREGDHQVKHVVARACSLRLENVGWTGRQRSWTDDLLWHHGGHVIDEVLRLLPGSVEDVAATVGPVWEGSGLPMDYAISLRTDANAIASIALSYNARLGASDYLVITDRDTVSVAGAEVRAASGPIVTGLDAAAVQEAAVLAQDRDFLAAIAEARSPIADGAAILPVLRVQQRVADQGRGRA
jgi:2-hydroxy-4-carboxymuconate semialdehyde hemiacetal dehydrogenase